MSYRSAIYHAVVFCAFCCFASTAALANDDAQNPSPFLPTGLLAHPDESDYSADQLVKDYGPWLHDMRKKHPANLVHEEQ